MRYFKYCIAIFVLLMFSVNAHAEKSIGYRMGLIDKFSDTGWMIKTQEGTMLMGRESSPLIIEKKTKDGMSRLQVNPWRFSVNDKLVAEKIKTIAGQYCYVKYEEELLNVSFNETAYRVLDVFPIDKGIVLDKEYIDKSKKVSKSEGFRIGRIVKASRKGVLVKTWEVIFQAGEAGNQFLQFTIEDEQLFEAAVKCLQAGKKVKIEYLNLGALGAFQFGDTNYRIIKISQIDDL